MPVVRTYGLQGGLVESLPDVEACDRRSMDDGASTISTDDRSDWTGDRDLSFSYCHDAQTDESASCSNGSTPSLGWPLGGRRDRSCDGLSPSLGWPLGARRDRSCDGPSPPSSKMGSRRANSFMWEEKREKRETELSEVELMKERFAKLLLGEDMSGGAKGVSTALAISNAVTNLSASLFGELWRLEPLCDERRKRWRREMEWLLSVSDHIVELVPSWQTFPDGSSTEVMITRPRSDLHINLPALRKLDAMLLDSLDLYTDTEFWYVDRGIVMAEKESKSGSRLSMQRQEEKWWLPTPKVPVNGLSEEGRRKLQHQREAISQILKAAMAINAQVLMEMEVPDVYWDSLPKNGKSSLGDTIYKHLSADNFSADHLLSMVDLSSEHSQLEVANRLETAILVWRRKIQSKHSNAAAKSSWGMMKELVVADENRREQIADRAESMLLSLKLKFPGLPQTALDMNKIQYNKDVGQSILESYSRVLESLAFNIIARIDDVLYTDDMVKKSMTLPPAPPSRPTNQIKRSNVVHNVHTTTLTTPYTTPLISPNTSPILSPLQHQIPNSPHDNGDSYAVIRGPNFKPVLSDWPGDKVDTTLKKDHELVKVPPEETKRWSYAGNLESSNALRGNALTRD
ncbi:hypothetical protein KC19_1G107600 [Ceratodon purpureus]|uniref:PRONE domain-containing protein n=1 Tax=Ceratodon purpureus TaxID=3225 RepID=A0A8T0J3P4_CERPU|nr:hypothetical protein KC19_1G107600 [Ceratodon purpureus]